MILDSIDRMKSKLNREIYLLLHPTLWRKRIQLNGIPKIFCFSKLEIGENVSINDDVFIQASGGVRIGDCVTLSRNVMILTESIDIVDYLKISKEKLRPHVKKPVMIDSGTWIAAGVIICPGVKIAKDCVVAAGSVVTHDLNENQCFYAGNPAKLIRRFEERR